MKSIFERSREEMRNVALRVLIPVIEIKTFSKRCTVCFQKYVASGVIQARNYLQQRLVTIRKNSKRVISCIEMLEY